VAGLILFCWMLFLSQDVRPNAFNTAVEGKLKEDFTSFSIFITMLLFVGWSLTTLFYKPLTSQKSSDIINP
jgi:hypothetical protein